MSTFHSCRPGGGVQHGPAEPGVHVRQRERGQARVCGAALVACAARRDSGVVLEARAVARLARVLRLGAADLNAAAGEAVAGYAERLLAARKTAAPGEAGVMAVQT